MEHNGRRVAGRRHDQAPTNQEVLGHSRRARNATEIAAVTGNTRQAVQNMLTKMYAEGKVEKATDGAILPSFTRPSVRVL